VPTFKLRNADDARVAGKVSNKIQRETKTLVQAIGAVVTRLRVEKKWSQVDLAIKAGYTSGWVSKMERGNVNPKLELIVALADTFDLELSQFFARVERMQRRKKGPTTNRSGSS
jgi:DNA-binding XRE family transcriptional regulator